MWRTFANAFSILGILSSFLFALYLHSRLGGVIPVLEQVYVPDLSTVAMALSNLGDVVWWTMAYIFIQGCSIALREAQALFSQLVDGLLSIAPLLVLWSKIGEASRPGFWGVTGTLLDPLTFHEWVFTIGFMGVLIDLFVIGSLVYILLFRASDFFTGR